MQKTILALAVVLGSSAAQAGQIHLKHGKISTTALESVYEAAPRNGMLLRMPTLIGWDPVQDLKNGAESVGKGVAHVINEVPPIIVQTQKNAADGRNAVNERLAATEEHVRTDTLPAIDAGVRHLISEGDHGMPWGDPRCAGNQNDWRCDKDLPRADRTVRRQDEPDTLPPFHLQQISGQKITVTFKNLSGVARVVQVYDVNGSGWVSSQSVSAWGTMSVPLKVDGVGKAKATLRFQSGNGPDLTCSFLNDHDVESF